MIAPMLRIITVFIAFSTCTAVYAKSSETIVNRSTFGCTTEGEYRRLSGYMLEDPAAFKSAFTSSVINGECKYFEENDVVFLTDYSLTQGLAKVRGKGDTNDYWTNAGDID